MTESLTISGLALKIFLNKHYYNNIPLINKKDVFDDIHKSYYGGRVEVFNPLVINLILLMKIHFIPLLL